MFRLRCQFNSVPVRTLLILASMLISAGMAQAQSSVFTYQGRLTDTGTAANGNYDFQFALSDALSGGTQIGSPLARSSVAVANGIFTVQLDFGAGAFPGADRFLEISVRVPGGSSFITLAPRQQINSAAYGIRSLKASSADTATNAIQLGGVAANQYVQITDERLSDPRPPTVGNSNYIQNTTSQQSSTNFNISGNGTAGGTLSASNINTSTGYNIAGARVLSNPGSNNLFAGVGAGSNNTGDFNSFFGPDAGRGNTAGNENSFFGNGAGYFNTTGGANSFFGKQAGQSTRASFNSFFGWQAGVFNNTGGFNSFFGVDAGLSNTTEGNNTFVGASSNGFAGVTNATAIGFRASVTQSNSLVLGSINGQNGATANTNVGIGTTTPAARLDIRGTGPTDIALRISDGGIKVAGAGLGTTTPVFIHRVTSGNITCANCTSIDHPLTNGASNAILIVTPNWNPDGAGGTYNNHPIGVFYDTGTTRWVIFNQDLGPMPTNAAFNVLVVKP